MKKLFYFAVLSLLAAACKQSPDQLRLTGSGISSSNEIYVYDIADDEVIDTIKTENGNFTYTLDCTGEPKLLALTNRQDFLRYFVAEKGNITLNGGTDEVKGSPLNNRLTDFLKACKEARKQNTESEIAIFEKMEKEERELTQEEEDEMKALDKKIVDIVKEYYEKDKDGILGVAQLIYIQYIATDEEFIELYEQGGQMVKDFPPFVNLLEAKANMKRTEAGGMFIDFEGVNPKDMTQIIKLSDFAGKDKYVLLDFWASWCGPCRQAMPGIKALDDKYSDKGLEVIGVVISDEIENHLKAAEELNITWTQIFDNKNYINTLYGIEGIPTLILLDKDGTILARTHNEEEIVEMIENLLPGE